MDTNQKLVLRRRPRAELLGLQKVDGSWVDPNYQSLIGQELRRGEILNLAEVAAMLQCSEDYLYRVDRKELPASKVGKNLIFDRDDVLMFVRSQKSRGLPRLPYAKLEMERVAASSKPVFDPVRRLAERDMKDQVNAPAPNKNKSRPI